MLRELRGNFSTETASTKEDTQAIPGDQAEKTTTVTETKNGVKGVTRPDAAEAQSSDWQETPTENSHSEQQTEKRIQNNKMV